VRVSNECLESAFKAYVHQLRPNTEYLKIFRESIVVAYENKFAQSLELREKLERELREKRESKRKLNEAFIYRNAIGEQDYREMKEALEQEILTLELKVNEARQEEMEIDELLDFAENLLLNAAGVWNQSGLEQKQRLQQVLFPSGLTYKDGVYRTLATSPMFNMLEGVVDQNGGLVALPGIEPGFED
jgi:hypothetical protein